VQTHNLLQVSTSVDDPNHLIYMGTGSSNSVQEILARIRMLAFAPGGTNDPPRGGVCVGVSTNPPIIINGVLTDTNWSGYNIQFRDNAQDGVPGRQFKFRDDRRAWGPPGLRTNIPGQTILGWANDVWYWLRLRLDPMADGTNDVFGKVWVADGLTPEPAEWQMLWADASLPTPLHSGWAGITGSSLDGLSQFEVDYVLIKDAGLPNTKVSFGVHGAGPVSPLIHRIARSSSNIVVDWFGGTLQQGTDLFGPWTDVIANTPYAFPIDTNADNFFRVQR
jgi:hypothetical protein